MRDRATPVCAWPAATGLVARRTTADAGLADGWWWGDSPGGLALP